MGAKKLFTISSLSDFIQKEVRHEDFSIKRLLEGEPEELIVSGDVLGPLKIIGRESKALILRSHGLFFSRFRAGDQVDIAIVDPLTKKFNVMTSTSINAIRFPALGVLEVVVAGQLIPADAGELFLLPKTHSGIKKLIHQKLWILRGSGFGPNIIPLTQSPPGIISNI